jgi:hypothetical protein
MFALGNQHTIGGKMTTMKGTWYLESDFQGN